MRNLIYRKTNPLFRLTVVITTVSFLLSTCVMYAPMVCAESVPYLPPPAQLMTASATFSPVVLKGIKFYPDDPFKLDFILNEGSEKLTNEQLQEETNRLVKYFLSALTIPAKDLWVNLSPYEQERIIPDALGLTDIGRDLLGQDYILKQLSSSLTYPESDLGKQYWQSVQERARKIYGTSKMPVNTYNKIWIVPGETQVFESGTNAVITQMDLKVMTEEDYNALSHNQPMQIKKADTADLSARVLKDLIIPEIEKDVNNGKNFAYLRQIQSAIVLAGWFKLRLKESIYSRLYIDKSRVTGIKNEDPQIKEKVFNQYVEAFKAGAYNYIKKDVDPARHAIVTRSYFSGGYDGASAQTSRAQGGSLNVTGSTTATPQSDAQLVQKAGPSGTVAPVVLAQASGQEIPTKSAPQVAAAPVQPSAGPKPSRSSGSKVGVLGMLALAVGLGGAGVAATAKPAKADTGAPVERTANKRVGVFSWVEIALASLKGKIVTITVPSDLKPMTSPLFQSLDEKPAFEANKSREARKADIKKLRESDRFIEELSFKDAVDEAYGQGSSNAIVVNRTPEERENILQQFTVKFKANFDILSEFLGSDTMAAALAATMVEMGIDGRIGYLIFSGKIVVSPEEAYDSVRSKAQAEVSKGLAEIDLWSSEFNKWSNLEGLNFGGNKKIEITPQISQAFKQLAAYIKSSGINDEQTKAILAAIPKGFFRTMAEKRIQSAQIIRANGKQQMLRYASNSSVVGVIVDLMQGGRTKSGQVIPGRSNILFIGTIDEVGAFQEGLREFFEVMNPGGPGPQFRQRQTIPMPGAPGAKSGTITIETNQMTRPFFNTPSAMASLPLDKGSNAYAPNSEVADYGKGGTQSVDFTTKKYTDKGMSPKAAQAQAESDVDALRRAMLSSDMGREEVIAVNLSDDKGRNIIDTESGTPITSQVYVTIENSLTTGDSRGEKITRKIFASSLQRAADMFGVKNLKNLVVADLKRSPHVAEDHTGNGFIGINMAALSRIADPLVRSVVTEVALSHELAHEVSGRSDEAFEQEQYKRDVALMQELAAKAGVSPDAVRAALVQSGVFDAEAEFTKGGISIEKMRLVVKSDGTAVPMLKDVEIDPAKFKGFTFNVTSLQRNMTGAQIFLAKAY